MSSLRPLVVLFALSTTVPTLAAEPAPEGKPAATSEAQKPRCEHGVQKSICTRCNPKLATVFKAKGDWCVEHERPESQCALCHPDLAEKGVK
jgi:hypothetical protein